MPTSRGFRLRRPSAQIATVVSEVLSALSICAPVLCLDAPAAFAQPVAPANLVAEIPAQPLSQALAAFANQTGLQLVYVSGIVRSQRSQSVPAGLGAREALARLLQGTGLRFEYLTPQSIRILAVALPPQTTTKIPASGEAGEVIVTANRRAESLQDVPITIQVLTNATLAKLHATTFDDFVSSLPGVTARGVGPAQNDIYVRGLGVGGFGIQGADLALLSRTLPCTSTSNLSSFRGAISTSTPPTSSALSCWRVRRARCLEPEPKRVSCAT
jgi:outer membrane receptor protein involved in Fe transport